LTGAFLAALLALAGEVAVAAAADAPATAKKAVPAKKKPASVKKPVTAQAKKKPEGKAKTARPRGARATDGKKAAPGKAAAAKRREAAADPSAARQSSATAAARAAARQRRLKRVDRAASQIREIAKARRPAQGTAAGKLPKPLTLPPATAALLSAVVAAEPILPPAPPATTIAGTTTAETATTTAPDTASAATATAAPATTKPPAATATTARPRARSALRSSFLSRGVDADARLTVSAGVPEGFEEFLKPQQTLVDVYVGGRPIGTFMAEFTPDGIAFQRPEEIAERIPNALNRGELAHRLMGRLDRNSELVCLGGQSRDCGRLEPEVIGVIFDEGRFRADLFLHPDQLAVQEQAMSRYLPPPADPDAVTLVQNLTVVAAMDNKTDGTHTLSGNTWVGRGADHVHAQWVSTQEQDLAIDQLAWRRDEPDHSYVAGLFEARNDDLYFAQSALLAGAGAGRSLKLRTDIASESATRVLVFLDSRSAVEIYRDGRLLSSQFYDPGNQVLDTAGLPYGSYDIDIRITDAAGTVRTLNRFFIKTTQLAPPGEPQWFVEGGQVLLRSMDSTLPEDAATLQLRGGWRDRLREDVGYALAGAAVDTHALAEGSLTWLQPRYSMAGSLMLSTQGDSGWATVANGRLGKLSGGLGLRYARAANPPGESDDYQLVPGSSFSRNLSLNYPVWQGQLSAQVFNTRTGGTESDIYTLRFTRNLQLGYFPPIFLNAQVTRSDGDLVASLGVDISGFGEHWNWRLNPGLRHHAPETGAASNALALSASGGWRDGDRFAEDVEAGLRTTVEDTATTVGVDARYGSDYGRLQASMDDISADSGNSRRFNARYEASFVAGGGHHAFGGRQMAAGSVLVDLRSAPENAEFDVYVDSRRYYSVRGGSQVPLMLPAYRSYAISLVDRGVNLLQFDTQPRQVTVYPGTVVALTYDVERVVVAFGRLLQRPADCGDAAGCAPVPLANARLIGISGLAMTEADGSFQAEVLTGTRQMRATRGGVVCQVELPAPRWVNDILMLGDLECVTAAAPVASPAPAAVPVNPEVGTPARDSLPADALSGKLVAEPEPEPVPATEARPETVVAPAAEVPAAIIAAPVAPSSDAGTEAAAGTPPASITSPAVPAAPVRAGVNPEPVAEKADARSAVTKRVAKPRTKVVRQAEQRRRRDRLRRNAAKVEKTRAELVISKTLKPKKAPVKKAEKRPANRRERLKRNADKVEKLLKE
jgi:hypothetical protein